MRKQHILLLDRAPDFAAMIATALKHQFNVDIAETLPRALAATRHPLHAGFLVDITGSSDDPGMDFLHSLRQTADTRPAIAISGNLDRELPSRCYEAGADGFVPKTRALVRELRGLLPRLLPPSRGAIHQAVQRTDGMALPRHSFRFGGATIEPTEMRVRFKNRIVDVNPKELGILFVLSRHPGALVRRSDILAQIWGPEAVPTSKSIDTYMTRLRRVYAQGGVDFKSLVTVKSKVGWRVSVAAS